MKPLQHDCGSIKFNIFTGEDDFIMQIVCAKCKKVLK